MLLCLCFVRGGLCPTPGFQGQRVHSSRSPEKRKHSGNDEEEEEEEDAAAEAEEEDESEATDHSSGKCHATRLNLMFCINTGEH